MTKNICGGKGAKKRARKYVNNRNQPRQMIYKKSDQEYARLTKALGCNRFTCVCNDGETRMAHIPGSLRWTRFREEDYVIVSIRIGIDFSKCDILHKYNPTEVKQLEEEKLIDEIIPKNIQINEDEFIESLEQEPKDDEVNRINIEIDDIVFDDI